MRRFVPGATLAAPVLISLLVAPAAHAVWPTSPYVNLPVCTATGNQLVPSVISDGSGGFYVCWDDLRSGAYRLYLQRVLATGQIAAGWPVDGLRVANAGGCRSGQMVLGPGGSVIIAWTDDRSDGSTLDIYATRVEPNGTFGAGWPVDGRQLSNVVGKYEHDPRIATDGAGGAYVSWTLQFAPTDFDIYVSRVLANGTIAPGISTGGDAICTLTSNQLSAVIAADGSGNAIIAWKDERSLGNTVYDVYAQKQLASGAQAWTSSGVPLTGVGSSENVNNPCVLPDGAGGVVVAFETIGSPPAYELSIQRVNGLGVPQWGTSGVAFASQSNAMHDIDLVSDGAGGWIAGWVDYRDGVEYAAVFARRILSTGTATWATNGVRAMGSTGSAAFPLLASDGAGGAIVVWGGSLWPSIESNIRGQRFGPGGQRMWGTNGAVVSAAAFVASRPDLCEDGAGGAFIAWMDDRSHIAPHDIYAQRVDRFGALGEATPKISKIADVPNDQGGFASLQWTSSTLDAEPDRVVRTYSLWRRVPGGTPPAVVAGSAPVLADEVLTPEGGPAYRTSAEGTQVIYWEYLTSKPAASLPGYSAVVATTSDSMPGSNPRTSFRVRAETIDGAMYWDSPADSGYSVDNLAPATPTPFTGNYSAGRAFLFWGANQESDFATYRLYRGTTSGFVPGPGNLVIESPTAGHVDPAGSPYWYKLAAVDLHGNVSGYALLLPSGALAVGDPRLPTAFALSPIAPNPSRGPMDIAFALPRAARVTIALYDAASRRVRELLAGEREPGEHAVRWDGRDESGSNAAAGLYFVRMEAGPFRADRRFVRIR